MHVAELELHAQSRQRAKRSTQAPSVLTCSCAGIHVVELELSPNGVFTHISTERFNLCSPPTHTDPPLPRRTPAPVRSRCSARTTSRARAALAKWERGGSRSAAKWDGHRYKDTDVESKRWAKWVEKVPVGRVVVICITDTAMARTRPLGAHRIADASAMHARARPATAPSILSAQTCLRRQSVRARQCCMRARTSARSAARRRIDLAALHARAGEIVYEALRKLGAASSLTFIG